MRSSTYAYLFDEKIPYETVVKAFLKLEKKISICRS